MYFEFGGGGGVSRASDGDGVCGNPPPENFEILKLGNATVIIHLFIFYLKLVEGGEDLSPPAAPRLRRPCCQS